MQIQLKDKQYLTKTKQIFIEEVLKIAEENGAALDFDGKSGAWILKRGGCFGLSFGEDLNFDDGLFQLCRCYVLTRGLDLEIPSN